MNASLFITWFRSEVSCALYLCSAMCMSGVDLMKGMAGFEETVNPSMAEEDEVEEQQDGETVRHSPRLCKPFPLPSTDDLRTRAAVAGDAGRGGGQVRHGWRGGVSPHVRFHGGGEGDGG